MFPSYKKLAKNVLIPNLTLELEKNQGEFFKNKIPTVNEFVIKSINMHKFERNENTHNDYMGIYHNHIKDVLGFKTLDKVKVSDLKQWQNDLMTIKGLSPSRVKTCRKVLNTMYKDAIDDEIIEINPLSKVSAPTVIAPEIKPFTPDEAITIINNAVGQIQNFVALAFFSGARSGEMLGLKWEDIDFFKKEISIKRTIKMGKINTPKTISSIRTIDMIDSLIPFLQNQYALTGSKGSYVFLNKNGNHIYDIKRIRDTHWKKLLAKCELEYRTIYQTRHTFASMMVENEDILWVSKMLGHKDSTITLQRYAKYIKKPEIKRGSFLENKMSVIGSQSVSQEKLVA